MCPLLTSAFTVEVSEIGMQSKVFCKIQSYDEKELVVEIRKKHFRMPVESVVFQKVKGAFTTLTMPRPLCEQYFADKKLCAP
mgnify:FL=1